MIGLYEPMFGGRAALPLATIQQLGPELKRGDICTRILSIGGRDIEVSIHEANAILRRPLQLIPAQPSTSLCHVYFNAGWKVSRSAIIAWALCLDGEVRPVTAGGVNDGLDDRGRGFAVELPDDTIRFTGPDGNSYRNVAALLDDYRNGSLKDD